ncbi:MAG: hypothetical protein Ta2F_07520 [Termitinemataceae bacterium]|nr:MAG: hypothetical protein Ta2F_07520 [Termitinemataceae bacterium]
MNTLVKYPITLGSALSDIDRFMGTFFGEGSADTGLRSFLREPAVDIQESDAAYLIEAELPGVDEKDIEVNINGGVLAIETKSCTETETKKKDSGKNYVMRERKAKTFSRTFHLPENADPDTINASFKNGLLSLEIKKRQEAQKRVIPISS